MRKTSFFLMAFFAVLLTSQNAMAYLDPASGAIILQALVAGVAGAAVVLKMYWARVKDVLGFGPKKDILEDSVSTKLSEEEE